MIDNDIISPGQLRFWVHYPTEYFILFRVIEVRDLSDVCWEVLQAGKFRLFHEKFIQTSSRSYT